MIRNKWDRCVPIPKKANLQPENIILDKTWSISSNTACQNLLDKWSGIFKLSTEQRDKKVILNLAQMGDESYQVNVSENNIEVTAGGISGLDYAMQTLWQISPDGYIPMGTIEDSPDLKIRGFHINFDSYRQMGIEDALYSLKNAAALKLNTVLIEYSNRFPFQKHSTINAPTALNPNEINKLLNFAKDNYIEVIPLQQCFGHLNYMLKYDEYSSIREDNIKKDQLCPENPEAFKIFTELAEEIIVQHPGIRYFHIGGDETRSLGTCPACRDKVKKRGISRLYIDYVNKVCRWLLEKNLTPIMWDDMICAHPECIDLLDKNIVIMYWDYWTTGKESPYFIARYNRADKPVTIYDTSWDTAYQSELTDLERKIMKDFACGVDLKDNLGKDFMSVYGPYLGAGFPKRIKGFPYLEYYMDKGFKVIGAPTALGNGDDYYSLPNYWRFIPNIKTICDRCTEARAEGVITSAWYNYPPVMFQYGLAASAQFTWGTSGNAKLVIDTNNSPCYN